MTLPELKTPWLAIELTTVVSTGDELRRELGPRHVLNGKSVRAVARRQDCDDVLLTIEDGSGHCAVVHLTYSGREESDPKWPSTEIFPSLEEWRLKRMIPDHEDFENMKKEPNQPPQRNAGSRPAPGDSSASETPSSLGPRG